MITTPKLPKNLSITNKSLCINEEAMFCGREKIQQERKKGIVLPFYQFCVIIYLSFVKPPSLILTLIGRHFCHLVEHQRSNISEFQKHLCAVYEKHYLCSKFRPLITDKRIRIDECFVPANIQIIHDRSQRMSKSPVELKDVLREAFSQNGKSKTLFINASTGMGKTTFCEKLLSSWCTTVKTSLKLDDSKKPCEDWATVDKAFMDIMNNFSYVFYVSLRHVADEKNCRRDDQKTSFESRRH